MEDHAGPFADMHLRQLFCSQGMRTLWGKMGRRSVPLMHSHSTVKPLDTSNPSPHIMAAPEPQLAPGILAEKADSFQLEHGCKGSDSEEYQEYLRLENEVFIGQKKAKLLRKMDWWVLRPSYIPAGLC